MQASPACFFGGSLLVDTHGAAIDHLHLAVIGLNDRIHELVSDARLSPTIEAVIDRRRADHNGPAHRPTVSQIATPKDAV
jgi:hypothetical protein